MNGERRAHILTAPRGSSRVGRTIYFDTESRVDADYIHHPYLIVARFVRQHPDRYEYERTYADGYDAPLSSFADDIDRFCKAKTKTEVVAHNLGYDILAVGLLPSLVALGWVMGDLFEKGLSCIVRMRRPDGASLLMYSSTNIYQESLEKLGKMLGIPKLSVKYNSDDLPTMVAYCRRDVAILAAAMEHFHTFVETEQLGNHMTTAAGQAFQAFRHRFMSHKIYIHDSERVLSLERAAYHGGRVECWHIGTLPRRFWYKMDVNSMYPAVMRSERYPVRLLTHRTQVTISDLWRWLRDGRCLIAGVTLTTDRPRFAVVHDGKLVFPVGTFTTTLTTPELAAALDNEEIVAVHECAVYESAPIFAPFIDYFMAKKIDAERDKNAILRYFYKLMMNSLYGKFGQRKERIEDAGTCDPSAVSYEQCINADTGVVYTRKRFAGRVFDCFPGEDESFNSSPAVAAHVTAHARLLLWRLIETAGAGHVAYMDTDSLFVDGRGYRNLTAAGAVDPLALGALKCEKRTQTLTIRAPKDYTFGRETRRKGINRDAVQVGPQTWRVVQWGKMATALRRGRIDRFQNTVITKTLTPRYDKGVVQVSGRVLPLTL